MYYKRTNALTVIIFLLTLCHVQVIGAPPAATVPTVNTGNVYVDISVLNVRQCPGISCKILGTVKKDMKLKVLALKGNWLKINFNNDTGYISKKYVRVTRQTERKTGVKGQNAEAPTAVKIIAEKLPVKSILTWVIILSLAVMLGFLFCYYTDLDEKFIGLLGSSKDGGIGWPMVTSALCGLLLAGSMMINGKEAEWFLTQGIGIIPTCHTAVHWVISVALLIAIMTLLGVLAESVVRMGLKYALLRFLIVTIICGITFFVAFYMTILLAFVAAIIIALCIAGAFLSAFANSGYRRVYYYYE